MSTCLITWLSHDYRYLKYTLDKYVESDYTLVYFHYGLTSVNKPSYGWLYQIYKEIDRKLVSSIYVCMYVCMYVYM